MAQSIHEEVWQLLSLNSKSSKSSINKCSKHIHYVHVRRGGFVNLETPNLRFTALVGLCQGRTNPAFSKPCLCLSDTRHFRRLRGSDKRSPCFQWVECKFVIFAVFVKTAPLWQETKTRFTKNTVCATPIVNLKSLPLSVGYTPARNYFEINSENIFHLTEMRFSKKEFPNNFPM